MTDLTYMNHDDLKDVREALDLSTRELAWLVGLSWKSIRKATAYKGRPPHPTLVRMVEWMRDGVLSDEWIDEKLADLPPRWKGNAPVDPMPPSVFETLVDSLGISRDEVADILNVERADLDKWITTRPHPVAATAIRLLAGGLRPPEWPETAKAREAVVHH